MCARCSESWRRCGEDERRLQSWRRCVRVGYVEKEQNETKICGALDSIKDRKPRDEYDIFGEYVANSLRTIESKDARRAKMIKLDINEISIEHERALL
ncbi:hypothetical protein Y032_0131g1639 [Ancylostoma ceylanicum]|nr:hypothetical protein Y032_0131g1639 [Ancylostoma ceylanicum]